MRVIGIDCGTAITGWAVLEREEDRNIYNVIDYGVIRTSSKSPMPLRLSELYEDLNKLVKKHKPVEMAVESIFFFKNQKTVISVGQARGVTILAGVNLNLEVYDYTPLQVKQAITGYGRADKQQVQRMVKTILGLREVPKPDDAADALAVCICHLNSRNTNLS